MFTIDSNCTGCIWVEYSVLYHKYLAVLGQHKYKDKTTKNENDEMSMNNDMTTHHLHFKGQSAKEF